MIILLDLVTCMHSYFYVMIGCCFNTEKLIKEKEMKQEKIKIYDRVDLRQCHRQ